MSTHTCFDQIDAKLAPHNARIAHGISMNLNSGELRAAYYVTTEKVDASKRTKKPPLVPMIHCPFCGVDLSEVES